MATIEDATRLGLAVQVFLARPPLDPLLNPHIPTDVLKQRLELLLQYLESLGVLTADEGTSLRDYVRDGKAPATPSGPPLLTTGTLLTSVVLYLNDIGPGSLFGGMLPALSHVVDAALDGALQGGDQAALTCAAIATTQVLQGIKSVRAEVSVDAVTGLKSGIKSGLGLKS